MKFPLSLATVLPACVLALSACSSVTPATGTAAATTAAPASAQDVRQLGEIVDLRSGQRLSAEQLLARLATAPRVIVGEQHDQLSHHQIEQWLLQQLQGQRPQGSVLLEMLNPDQQAKVDKVKPWLQTDPVVRPEHVAELLAWVGLKHRMHAMPATLAGGEKQRLAIARAVVNRPEILLADEPTGNVDPEMGLRILKLFVELNRLGTTVLFATHDEDLVARSGMPVLHLENGRLTAHGARP